MADETFLTERLGVGDWPDTTGGAQVIAITDVQATQDPDSRIDGRVQFAVDVTPDQQHAAIAAAGWRPDGLAHIEVVDHRQGSSWVVKRVAELRERHETIGPVVLDSRGPAGSLMSDFVAAGIEVEDVSAGEHARACGMLLDAFTGAGAVDDDGEAVRTLRHLGQPELLSALRGAAKRPLLDAWAWSRKTSGGNIAPLVAVTLAFGALKASAGAKSWLDDHDLVVLDD